MNIPHQNAVFVTFDEPTSTHHYHMKSIIYDGVHSGGVHSMGLDKWGMTCIYHYDILQRIVTALNELGFLTTVGSNHHYTCYILIIKWFVTKIFV